MNHIALLSESADPDITKPVLEQIAAALTRQLCEDYAGVWETRGHAVIVYSTEAEVPADADLAIIFDEAPDPGILGYHDVTAQGRPYEKVFWGPIKKSGGTLTKTANALSVTLSHECLELEADPYANFWADLPDGKTEEALELCDRVEGDEYEIDGVAVSNFLGPRAFRQGVGPYDFLGMQGDPRGTNAPFETRSTGYHIRRTGGPDGVTTSEFGASYPEHKKEQKLAAGSRAAKRGLTTVTPDGGYTIALKDSATT